MVSVRAAASTLTSLCAPALDTYSAVPTTEGDSSALIVSLGFFFLGVKLCIYGNDVNVS